MVYCFFFHRFFCCFFAFYSFFVVFLWILCVVLISTNSFWILEADGNPMQGARTYIPILCRIWAQIYRASRYLQSHHAAVCALCSCAGPPCVPSGPHCVAALTPCSHICPPYMSAWAPWAPALLPCSPCQCPCRLEDVSAPVLSPLCFGAAAMDDHLSVSVKNCTFFL